MPINYELPIALEPGMVKPKITKTHLPFQQFYPNLTYCTAAFFMILIVLGVISVNQVHANIIYNYSAKGDPVFLITLGDNIFM